MVIERAGADDPLSLALLEADREHFEAFRRENDAVTFPEPPPMDPGHGSGD